MAGGDGGAPGRLVRLPGGAGLTDLTDGAAECDGGRWAMVAIGMVQYVGDGAGRLVSAPGGR